MADDALHLLHAPMRIDRLMQLGRDRGMPITGVDLGYAIHMAFGELFDQEAPSVFAIDQQRRGLIDVLAYTRLDAGALTERAQTFADARAWSTCDWDAVRSKPMPTTWPAGRRLGFRVRTCPVKRGRDPRGKMGERDAFLFACDGAPEHSVDRRTVYTEWFAELLDRTAGVKLERHSLTAYQRARLWRRTQGSTGNRRPRPLDRPDALFHGVLEVTDPAAFAMVLRRGIGRHRAFGFGMLLLRPPTDRAC